LHVFRQIETGGRENYGDDNDDGDDNNNNGRLSCVAVDIRATDQWCNDNCNHVPSYCPGGFCRCTSGGDSDDDSDDDGEKDVVASLTVVYKVKQRYTLDGDVELWEADISDAAFVETILSYVFEDSDSDDANTCRDNNCCQITGVYDHDDHSKGNYKGKGKGRKLLSSSKVDIDYELNIYESAQLDVDINELLTSEVFVTQVSHALASNEDFPYDDTSAELTYYEVDTSSGEVTVLVGEADSLIIDYTVDVASTITPFIYIASVLMLGWYLLLN